ncbi:MAG: glucose-6-phosphate isomerase [Elusimicrobiota bacterium]
MDDLIKLDYSNCMTDFVGDHGIYTDAILSLKNKLSGAHKAVLDKKAAGKLGFMELPYKQEETKKIKAVAKKLKTKYSDFVVAGIGGSALGNTALQTALRPLTWNLLAKRKRGGWLRLFVLDNVDPELISSHLDILSRRGTLINVISKSGTTAECLAIFFILSKSHKKNLLITTDAKKGLLREMVNNGLALESFVIPENVGGRFSVLSPVGLVSAAFCGIDVEKLLSGARQMDERCSTDDPLKNPALMYAAINWLMYQKDKKINVMMPYSNALYGIADWFRQLWAESLGKRQDINGNVVNVGPTPVKALGATDQHSQVQLYIEGPYDKIITFLSVEKYRKSVKIPLNPKEHYLGGHTLNELIKSEEEATRLALTKQNRPNCTIFLPEINENTIGQLIYMLELSTAYAGELFQINAFDQPGVELGKQLTYALLGRPGFEEKKKELETEFVASRTDKYTV